MAELTKRSVGQVIFRHTPGSLIALDEWGVYGMVSVIKGNPDSDVDKKLLFKKVRWFIEKWDEESEGRIRGFDISNMDSDSIIAIRPEHRVLWDFLPYMILECVNPECKIIINSSEGEFTGKCPRCKSGLKQFRYLWFHNCGILRPFVPITQVNCPKHGRSYLYLNDTGRFRSSTWRCRECSYERALGMLPCTDVVCRKKKSESPYLRASVWNDPWVYFPQVATFINLKEEQIKPVVESSIKDELLVSSYLGTIKAGENRLIAKAAHEDMQNVNCINCGVVIQASSKFCKECGAKQPEIPKEIKTKKNNKLSEELLSEDSELATFAALRDLERTTSFKDEKNKQKENQDIEKAALTEIIVQTLNSIGIDDIIFIGDFPLTYASLGYTRFQSKPPTWLRAFPQLSSHETRIPVYTNCITTEAWMIQLSAKYILEWLNANNITELPKDWPIIDKMDESEAKLWLLEFMANGSEDDSVIQLQNTIKELIHSLSHTFLQSLAIESGLDIASFGELLLPNVLTIIIYAGESDVGGLSASFNQGMASFLDLVVDQLRSCKFDPSCSEDDDGACVGCLYLPRGCVEFNNKLSRCYIFGGKTKNLSAKNIPIGFFDLKHR